VGEEPGVKQRHSVLLCARARNSPAYPHHFPLSLLTSSPFHLHAAAETGDW
jgi:hypothetical protein